MRGIDGRSRRLRVAVSLRLLVGTADGLYEIGSDAASTLSGYSVTSVAGTDGSLWTLLDERLVWHRDPEGAWAEVVGLDELSGNCLISVGTDVLIGTREAHLLRLSDGALEPVATFDHVEGRGDWYTPWGGPPDVRSGAVDESGSIFVNIHVGGIARSDDGGASWRPTIDFHSDVHEVIAIPGLVLAATARGLATSADRGETWAYSTEGLDATYARAVAVAEDIVLLSASRGPRGDRAAVYRRRIDSVDPFERCTQGLPGWFEHNIDTACLAASGTSVAFGTQDGEVYSSEDCGATWARVADGLPAVRNVAFAGEALLIE